MILGMDSDYFYNDIVDEILGLGFYEIGCLIPRFVFSKRELSSSWISSNAKSQRDKVITSIEHVMFCARGMFGEMNYVFSSIEYDLSSVRQKIVSLKESYGKRFNYCLRDIYRHINEIIRKLSIYLIPALRERKRIRSEIPNEIMVESEHLREKYWEIAARERAMFQLYHLPNPASEEVFILGLSSIPYIQILNNLIWLGVHWEDRKILSIGLPYDNMEGNVVFNMIDQRAMIFEKLNYQMNRFEILEGSRSAAPFFREVLSENC